MQHRLIFSKTLTDEALLVLDTDTCVPIPAIGEVVVLGFEDLYRLDKYTVVSRFTAYTENLIVTRVSVEPLE